MLRWQYYSYQYYSYQDLQKIKEILTYDSIGETTFYENENTIEYKIPRSKCILLSDLIELIKIGFIRFHLGQLLQLFINLLERVKYMERHNIEHNYLSLDRIWLKFQNNHNLTILYKEIQYEITFTGYKNIFYENPSIKEQPDFKSILQIIQDIINTFINDNMVCNKNCSSKNDIINNIYHVIINSCKKQVIEGTINTIHQLLLNNKFDHKYQTVSFDDKIIDYLKYSKRKSQEKQLRLKLLNLITKYDKNPLVLDLFLFEKIDEMRQNLKNWKCKDLDENYEQQQYQKLLQHYENQNQLLYKEACILITNMINDQLRVKLLPFYKFEMEQSQYQNIIDLIMGYKIFKYFENSKEIYKLGYRDFYNKLIFDYANRVINDYIDDYIQLQILITIKDLI